jgi:hypothetical protein
MTDETIHRVLSRISLKKLVMIPKPFLNTSGGFGKLWALGYLTVEKLNGKFYISLSLKGTLFLGVVGNAVT